MALTKPQHLSLQSEQLRLRVVMLQCACRTLRAASRLRAALLFQLRSAWQLDSYTALVVCDPTSPNIFQFRAGSEVSKLLSRPFFVELQSRYGNLYYVREEVNPLS